MFIEVKSSARRPEHAVDPAVTARFRKETHHPRGESFLSRTPAMSKTGLRCAMNVVLGDRDMANAVTQTDPFFAAGNVNPVGDYLFLSFPHV